MDCCVVMFLDFYRRFRNIFLNLCYSVFRWVIMCVVIVVWVVILEVVKIRGWIV